MPSFEYLDCELYLADENHARLCVAGRDFAGRPALADDVRVRLLEASLEPVRYGSVLFDALFTEHGNLLAGYREALAIARHERKVLRLRLHVSAVANPQLHGLAWELLYDPTRKLAVARSRDTAFSRYLSVPWPAGTPVAGPPRLLVVIANPGDLDDHGLEQIDQEGIRRSIAEALRPLAGRVEYELLEPPATAGRIRERLVDGRFHLLHVHAHGVLDPSGSTAHLVLEDEARRIGLVDESLAAEVVEGDRNLRLITLIACHSGVPTAKDPFAGLGSALVRRGIPAVVAMRRSISVDAAVRFSTHLYRNLACDGRIDRAVNESRQQLYLAAPERSDWGAPALFMRLGHGLLWQDAGAADRDTTVAASSSEKPRAAATSTHDAARARRDIARARHGGDAGHLAAIESRLGDLDAVDADVLLDLFRAYRALQDWDRMAGLYDRLPAYLRATEEVRQQLAFALNRRGDHDDAIWHLEQVLEEHGPSCETYGLLGRVFKDLWLKARTNGRSHLAQGYLDKAIDTYVRGFETDWRDAYPGINALTLLDVKGDGRSLKLKAELLPLVRFAVKQRLKSGKPDYWDHATLLELAVLDGDEQAAARDLADALARVRESWEPVTTARNLRLIRDGRSARGTVPAWLDRILAELESQ